MRFVGFHRFASENREVDILSVISGGENCLACFPHRTQDSVVVDPLTLLKKQTVDGRSRGGCVASMTCLFGFGLNHPINANTDTPAHLF